MEHCRICGSSEISTDDHSCFCNSCGYCWEKEQVSLLESYWPELVLNGGLF